MTQPEAIEKMLSGANIFLTGEPGAADIYDGNLDNNEGVCADCGEHCEMESR